MRSFIARGNFVWVISQELGLLIYTKFGEVIGPSDILLHFKSRQPQMPNFARLTSVVMVPKLSSAVGFVWFCRRKPRFRIRLPYLTKVDLMSSRTAQKAACSKQQHLKRCLLSHWQSQENVEKAGFQGFFNKHLPGIHLPTKDVGWECFERFVHFGRVQSE